MKTVGIVCCSNGQKHIDTEKIELLRKILLDLGEEAIFSDYIYEKESAFSGTARERADALMDFYKNGEIAAIYDISGGDIANGILPYLDYSVIAKSRKLFWGYSDLTTVINAIYAKTGCESVLYQVRNLISEHKELQLARFLDRNELFQVNYQFVQGTHMSGGVVGGNIRCFLKLAGTPYMPDLTDKILLLESRSGSVAQMETFLSQLEQIGAFDKVSGILLGTFTQMEKEQSKPDIVTLLKRHVRANMPIAITKEIGHGTDSKAIVIGKEYQFDSRLMNPLHDYLEESEYINFSDPEIEKLAMEFKKNASDDIELIRNIYHFVRDEIYHSWDIQSHTVTAKASDVLQYKTGICWAKSNLLAALLRANGIPCGICYQKLTLGDTADTGFCIHSLNAIYIKTLDKWIRVDARGNKSGIDAQLKLDEEQLAFSIREEIGEVDYKEIYARPSKKLMDVLDSNEDAIEMYANHLPDTL